MKKHFLLAIAFLALCGLVLAEVSTNNAVAVTDTAQTVAFTNARSNVTVINDGADAVYFRLFWCSETVVAATTASIKLELDESVSFSHNPRTETGLGYCNLSIVADTGDTATVRVINK